ncbi:NUDIX domain-containing protein [Collinsella sp. AGMB00827]|uniref:isopentenyl-diphosphate Delta-isomerase n=1 Tax=Collinsella ureilytica TaxID=2869515 RepID=A0ABS7MKC6_9ACTN|nr:NUDIX domain-containing protein [Collinsella urealyticum]MBY4797722.1 NUDIX domain-containing protein [Collinsella urealyticum]
MQEIAIVEVQVGEPPFALGAVAVVMPQGITVTAYSPAHAHLGATAQAIPRPEPGRTATVSILAVPCHRDEIPAREIAAALATRFDVPVAASAGLHVDAATEDDIHQLLDVTQQLIKKLIERIERIRRATWANEEQVVAVDSSGKPVRPISRHLAHQGDGILHQAFMIFLLQRTEHEPQLLLCRRSRSKRLWGGVLADTCSGHPLPGEELAAAAVRRLKEETGIELGSQDVSMLGHVVYQEDYGDGSCEHEWCAVFAAEYDQADVAIRSSRGSGAMNGLPVNTDEIEEVIPVKLHEIPGYLCGDPEPLAPWTLAALSDPQIQKALETFVYS